MGKKKFLPQIFYILLQHYMWLSFRIFRTAESPIFSKAGRLGFGLLSELQTCFKKI